MAAAVVDDAIEAAFEAKRQELASAAEARLGFAPGWARSHPRTMYLLGEEVAAWERGGSLQLRLDGPR